MKLNIFGYFVFVTYCILAVSVGANAQENSGELQEDEATALSILQDLELLDEPIEQTNQLGEMIPRQYAQLLFLDKLNGEVKKINLRVGDNVDEQFINITLKACYVPKASDVNDDVAYLVIQDVREELPSFDGWMIGSSPALSALDHPRYDVWVANCTDDGTAAIADGIVAPPVRPAE